MVDEYIDTIQNGTFFPSSALATLCLTKTKPISEIQLKRMKKGIMRYLGIHEGAYISELARELRVKPKEIVFAIKELKEEGLLI